tara:strand:+ start:5044 stop:5406 length:363 start_codon:yes stop_codon:yes gene_type:complete
MEAILAAAANLKVVVVAITFLVGIIIWIYKLRLDTNINTQAIEDLRLDFNNKSLEVDHKVEILRLSTKEDLKEIKDDFKEDFKLYKNKDGERAHRIFEKLDEIGREIVNIKVDNAKKGRD